MDPSSYEADWDRADGWDKPGHNDGERRAFQAPSSIFVLTHFLQANRYPARHREERKQSGKLFIFSISSLRSR
jgi:hypothetical protein